MDLNTTISNIARDAELQQRLQRLELQAMNVSWEDTGRSKGSSVGPNISDLTLRVGDKLMPVIRAPNFSDKTFDASIEHFKVYVGNEIEGRPLKQITLKEYLENIGEYTKSSTPNMYRPRDAALLVSGQACILPLATGKVAFNGALYNYQSEPNDPAVLTIMATAQGTSTQTVDRNTTTLYFNDHGNSVDLVVKRLADDRAARGVPLEGPMSAEEKEKNVVYLFQIPLKTKPRPVRDVYACSSGGGWGGFGVATLQCASYGGPSASASSNFSFGVQDKSTLERHAKGAAPARGMDHGIVEKGTESHGSYPGTRGLLLERDDRFPIRATVMFYNPTDSPHIEDASLLYFKDRINNLYSKGVNAGSLVTEPNKGRPTEHTVPISLQPPKPPTGGGFVFMD
jgi:hypothetical protein